MGDVLAGAVALLGACCEYVAAQYALVPLSWAWVKEAIPRSRIIYRGSGQWCADQ